MVCHEHPVFGGHMDSAVPRALAGALNDRGIATLRFNFRGVGGSGGTFSGGEREPDDLKAALEVVKSWTGIDGKRIAVAGYSFGAQVILKGLGGYKAAKSVVLVSPPLSSIDSSHVGKDKRPKLFLIGERDKLVGVAGLQQTVKAFPRAAELQIVPRADHTWRGHERELVERVAHYLEATLRR